MVNVSCDKRIPKKKILLSCGLITTGTGILLSWSYIFNAFLRFSLCLRQNSYLEEYWMNNPIPLHLDIYVFNWTNPEDIYKPGIKPRFKEVGPLSLREVREKRNIIYNQNKTVTYKQFHTFYFAKNRSVDINIPITTLNPILSSAAYMAKHNNFGFFMQTGMQMVFSQLKEEVAVTKPFEQYFIGGYPSPIVEMIGKLPLPQIPNLPFNGKFFWLVGRNGSNYEGTFNIGSEYDNFGVLQNWNYGSRNPHYKGRCGSLENFSTGELYRPYPDKDTIRVFVTDMCRDIPLDFEKEVDVNGVIGRKYSVGKRFLDNGTFYPENECFLPGERLPYGVTNISICNFGAPGFISLPHFHEADQYYIDQVEGLKPNASRHEFYIVLEPTTGIPLRVAGRIQLNFLLEPAKYVRLFQKVPRLMFPMLWVEEVAQLPDYILLIIKIVLHIPTALKLIGVTMIVFGAYMLFRILFQQLCDSVTHAHRHQLIIKELVPLHIFETKPKIIFETDMYCWDTKAHNIDN